MNAKDTFAVVQETLDLPSVDQFRRAFKLLPQLTDYDAHTLAADAYGIIAGRLNGIDARTLQRALAAEGLKTVVVREADLPQLPPFKTLKRADIRDEGIIFFDALDRPSEVAWDKVVVVAAGQIRMSRFKRLQTEHLKHHAGPMRGIFPVVQTDTRTQEVWMTRGILELFVMADPPRYRVLADEFIYRYLGDRKQTSSEDNFVLLVRDICSRASGALLNRGAEMIAAEAPRARAYPSMHAWEEEIVWQVWRRAGQPRVEES